MEAPEIDERPTNEEGGVEGDEEDWGLLQAFVAERHTEKIQGLEDIMQNWRLKDRMKTVSVALILCLNVGVDPPDVAKTQPCARLECWIDPLSMSPQKALEAIGCNLQKQYERWQPRARYKQTLDPTAEEIKKVTSTLRRNAKDERVLFHYNGHGVPKPTANGEIWVFNRSYTQYIPLSIYDLQTWMWSPSIYVFDCSNAGMIVDAFQQFADQHQREYEQLCQFESGRSSGAGGAATAASTAAPTPSSAAGESQSGVSGGGGAGGAGWMGHAAAGTAAATPPPNFKSCIQLAACATNQILPMNPELPADLFTACLTTPIKIALRWFVLQNTSRLVPKMTLELVDKIPGQLNDRRTMLGELNWIFTAITDTIAWNSLPRDLFQRLFRQDLLVASLFRNFLLAERILKSYDCTPVSWPKLPPTAQHPMWSAWDLALDICLSQLPQILDGKAAFQNSPFFEEQLTAFQVWLSHGTAVQQRSAPEQLPIVLQVLLSQVHRLRALELLGRFLDLGPWAVNLALSVGIFPYVLKLLQSSARELRPLLLFIWAKILAVDVTCQADLVRDGGHKYFLTVLLDASVPDDQRTLAAFVIARVVWNHPAGQEAVSQLALVSNALEMLHETSDEPLLRRWIVIAIGLAWDHDVNARWCAIRDSAHEKLLPLLQDAVPEVRAATAFALGTFVRSGGKGERSEHANSIDHSVTLRLVGAVQAEASPLVRKEIVVALQWVVLIFDSTFTQVALHQLTEEERAPAGGFQSPSPAAAPDAAAVPSSTSRQRLRSTGQSNLLGTSPELPSMVAANAGDRFSASGAFLAGSASTGSLAPPDPRIRRAASSSSLNSLSQSGQSPASGLVSAGSLSLNSIYGKMWLGLTALDRDPHPDVAALSRTVTDHIRNKAREQLAAMRDSAEAASRTYTHSNSSTDSTDSSNRALFVTGADSPPRSTTHLMRSTPSSLSRIRKRSIPTTICEEGTKERDKTKEALVRTGFVEWCARHLAEPAATVSTGCGPAGAGQAAAPTASHGDDLTVEFKIRGGTRQRDTELYYTREWRYNRNALVRREAAHEWRRPAAAARIDEQLFCSRNTSTPSVIRFHPYDPWLAVADKDGCTVWDWERSVRIGHLNNQQPKAARITSLEFLNGHDDALLLVGCDDGSVRVWRDYVPSEAKWRNPLANGSAATPLSDGGDGVSADADGGCHLVSAWNCIAEMSPSTRCSGLVLDWDQQSLQLLATGDVRLVRVWDVEREMKIADIPTGSEHCVTCVHHNPKERSLLVAGCGDGSVRLFDRRCAPTSARVMTWREHSHWVVEAQWINAAAAANSSSAMNLVSGSLTGDIRFMDARSPTSWNVIQTPGTAQGMTAMAIHPEAHLFACGSISQHINVHDWDTGEVRSVIKYHDGGGFMGHRIGAVSCLTFHPQRVCLAAGGMDQLISVFASEKPKK